MYGRYGIDELQKFLVVFYIAAAVLKNFFLWKIMYALSVVAAVIFIVRFFSKDIYIRQKENRKYLEIKDKVFGWFNRNQKVINDSKTHIFRTCPNCKAKIKLPRKKGNHVCNCPKCGKDFKVRVLW